MRVTSDSLSHQFMSEENPAERLQCSVKHAFITAWHEQGGSADSPPDSSQQGIMKRLKIIKEEGKIAEQLQEILRALPCTKRVPYKMKKSCI